MEGEPWRREGADGGGTVEGCQHPGSGGGGTRDVPSVNFCLSTLPAELFF